MKLKKGSSRHYTNAHAVEVTVGWRPTCPLLSRWLPPPSTTQDAFAAAQVELVALILRQLLIPSVPLPSTHGSHDVSLQAYMPTRPSLQFDAHAVQLAAAVLPAREYGVLAGHTTHSPVVELPYVPAGQAIADVLDVDPGGQ